MSVEANRADGWRMYANENGADAWIAVLKMQICTYNNCLSFRQLVKYFEYWKEFEFYHCGGLFRPLKFIFIAASCCWLTHQLFNKIFMFFCPCYLFVCLLYFVSLSLLVTRRACMPDRLLCCYVFDQYIKPNESEISKLFLSIIKEKVKRKISLDQIQRKLTSKIVHFMIIWLARFSPHAFLQDG